MIKVIVTGGRDFKGERLLRTHLDKLHKDTPILLLAHGACPTGADAFADKWAKDNDVLLKRYAADWKTHGRTADLIRNKFMVRDMMPDVVVACPGGRGTANCVQVAQSYNIPIQRPLDALIDEIFANYTETLEKL